MSEEAWVPWNGGTCSDTVTGEAIQLSDNAATLSVPVLPPVPAGSPASLLFWSESSY